MEDTEIEALQEVRTHDAGTHQEENSDFFCHYQRVSSAKDVEAGLAKMKVKYGDATHLTAAFRLENSVGPTGQGYIDDGEQGAGRSMLRKIKEKDLGNIAVFIARYYGGKHLGKRRFEIYEQLTEKAVQKCRAKIDRLSRSNRLQRSGSQLSQLSLLSQTSDHPNEENPEEVHSMQTEIQDNTSS